MGNFGINGGVPWLTNTDGERTSSFLQKTAMNMSAIFSRTAPALEIISFESIWSNLSQKIIASDPCDGTQISHFNGSLDSQQKNILLLGGFPLLFVRVTVTIINRFISSAFGKIHQLRKEMLLELEAPWLSK